jgi:hypothetical protein
MEQITLFTPPYKYIIDASSIFSQKPDEPHRRHIYKAKWKNIDEFIHDQVIVTCSEIESEIKDKPLVEWLHQQQCVILPITDEVQHNVRKIVTEHPELIDFANCKSSGDAFLIATAMHYGLTIITEENPKKAKTIPGVCRAYNIPCINITDLCEIEGWSF